MPLHYLIRVFDICEEIGPPAVESTTFAVKLIR